MARGKGGSSASVQNGNLPTFIDVKMTPEDRERFSAWYAKSGDRTAELIKLADNGYRVGIAWSGEHQSYTVSVTCRDSGSPNNGMCMTSFAKDLEQAVALAWYKCDVICAWEWAKYKPTPSELFG